MAAKVCPGLDVDRAWRASLIDLRGADEEVIDRAVALPYNGPRSYTGEDMLEIMVHGSPWIVRATLDAFIAAGARPADPGEFTRRALANGKIDLVQAEAVNELASAETAWQARVARAQADGRLSREFSELKDALVALLVDLEAALDFTQHEIPYDAAEAERRRRAILARARRLLATAPTGRRIRNGVRVVILGPPNSGKSTLFNILAGYERAIVSPHPGTTRDVIEVELEMDGVRVVLQDTAGMAATNDPVEREGVRRTRGVAADADAVLLLWPVDGEEGDVPVVGDDRPVIRIRSKWDLSAGGGAPAPWMTVSCHRGEGVDELRRVLETVVTAEVVDLGDEVVIADRHRGALETAVRELESADLGLPEVAAEAVRESLAAVRELTGEVATEDVLDRIFASFCIGK